MSFIPYVIEQNSRGEEAMIFIPGFFRIGLYFWEKKLPISLRV